MKKVIVILGFLYAFCLTLYPQTGEPVEWTFEKNNLTDSSYELVFRAVINDGWYIYGTYIPAGGPRATQPVFEELTGVVLDGTLEARGILREKFEPLFSMNVSYFKNNVELIQRVIITDRENFSIDGYIEYMACGEDQCLFEREPFSFGRASLNALLPNVINVAPVPGLVPVVPVVVPTNGEESTFKTNFWEPVIDQLRALSDVFETEISRSFWWIVFIKGFIAGLIAIFTPCMWPIIPITVSFFLKRKITPAKGKRDAIFYGISIIAIYLILGIVVTLIFGAQALNAIATSAFVNLLFFALLLVFGASLLGAFELRLPSSWTTKLDKKAEETRGFAGIFLMALALVLISFSCTGPIIGTLLVEVAVSGSILAPAIGMFGFAVALSIPFTLFALFPSWLQSMPKSGSWLNSVKVTLGFLITALSLKFLSSADLVYGWGILNREVFLVLWIVIFAMLGMYLIGKLRFKNDSELQSISVTRLALSIFSFAFALYMLPGLWGAPLRAISAFAPPLYTQEFNLYGGSVKTQFFNFDEGMEYAQRANKPALVYFTGHGCVNCRRMEANVWTVPDVRRIMTEEFVIISLYVDSRQPLDQVLTVEENGRTSRLRTIGDKWGFLQRHKFGANAQPYFVILDNEGKPVTGYFSFTDDASQFLNFLRTGLENYRNQSRGH